MRDCADFVFATDFWSRSFIYSCNEALFAAECAASTTKTSRNTVRNTALITVERPGRILQLRIAWCLLLRCNLSFAVPIYVVVSRKRRLASCEQHLKAVAHSLGIRRCKSYDSNPSWIFWQSLWAKYGQRRNTTYAHQRTHEVNGGDVRQRLAEDEYQDVYARSV